jgi:MbtH protein
MDADLPAVDGRPHRVVVNAEEQFSVWPADRPLPAGWSAVGPAGSRADCLAHIAHVWTDVRPRSARTPPAGAAG